jgi:rhodanese-related sulfurtransferase
MVPDKDSNIVVYCGKGIRSAFATNKLKEMGYTNVRNLKGGTKAWKKSGLPTKNVN